MSFGCYHYFPRRFGGGQTTCETIQSSLSAARGTAYNTERGTAVWAEDHAAARCLTEGWNQNARLGHIWDPDRCPKRILERWEKILGLIPDLADTERQRRRNVKAVFRRVGKPSIRAALIDELTEAMGAVFVDIEYIDLSIATIISPDASYPFGTQDTSTPWLSTTAKILVLTQKTTGMSDAQYFVEIDKGRKILDSVLPAWVTFLFYHAPEGEPSFVVAGGASQAGIYCDTPNTLDYCVFAH